MKAYEVIAQHIGKTITSIHEHYGDIVIQFNDNSQLIFKDQRCNTCGGHNIEGAEY